MFRKSKEDKEKEKFAIEFFNMAYGMSRASFLEDSTVEEAKHHMNEAMDIVIEKAWKDHKEELFSQ